MYLSNSSATSRMQDKVNHKAKRDCIEFRVFFLLDWLPYQG